MGKFVLFSISAGIIEVVSFEILTAVTSWDYWPRYLVALTLSVLWNFTMNRAFTFRSANNVPAAMLKVAALYAVFIPVSTVCGQCLAGDLGWDETLVLAVTMLCNIVSEYLYDRTVVFGRTIDTNKRAPEMMRGDANAPIGTSSARSHAISLNPSVAISTR